MNALVRARWMAAALLCACPALAGEASAWVDYGVVPDGSIYRWSRQDVTRTGDGVFDVWARVTYATPRPIPGTGSSAGKLASMANVRQRIFCAQRELQTMWFSYYDATGTTIVTNTIGQPRNTPRPDSVGGRLVASVCETLMGPPSRQ